MLKQNKNKQVHSSIINNINTVEETLQKMDESAISVVNLKKILPKDINHNTLMNILGHLDKENKILMGSKGITWIYNPNFNLKKAIAEGLEV